MVSLRRRFEGADRRRLIVAAGALAVTSTLIAGFVLEARTGYLKRDPMTIYVENWDEGRSEAEAVARQKIETVERERAIAEFKRQVAIDNAKMDAMRGK